MQASSEVLSARDVRGVVERLTGLSIGIVEQGESDPSYWAYAGQTQLFALPEDGHWNVMEVSPAGEATRYWSESDPMDAVANIRPLMGVLLPGVCDTDSFTMSFRVFVLEVDGDIERRYFDSPIGAVGISTRKLGADTEWSFALPAIDSYFTLMWRADVGGLDLDSVETGSEPAF
jgi:hypothetical protein